MWPVGRSRYRDVFLAAFGFGPYSCFFCHQEITFFEKFDVHHIDEDQSNNQPMNLAAAHRGCHVRYHATLTGASRAVAIHTGRVRKEETRKKMREAWDRRREKWGPSGKPVTDVV